jgi:NAD dependent epimerase/dehydratase family enzyme
VRLAPLTRPRFPLSGRPDSFVTTAPCARRGSIPKRCANAARLGLAGPVGSGRQSWSWISLADEARALIFAVDHDVSGPVNLVSPNPALAQDVTREIARQAGRPHWLPLPAVLLRAALRDAADDLLLCSQRVVPGVLLRAGFTHAEPTLESAVAAAWRDWRKRNA